MSGYVGVREQVDKDFHRALLKASLRRLKARLRGYTHDERLPSFEEAKSEWVRSSQSYRGMRTVEVERIVGSVGRYRDFDGSFLPRKNTMCERWSRVDSAYHQGIQLPAVSLYKIGDGYFVVDGNHRVSVARYHKVVTIDAEVVEIRGRLRTDAASRTVRAGDSSIYRAQPAPREGIAKGTWSARLLAFVSRSVLRHGSLAT
jgi:hypothetical protein